MLRLKKIYLYKSQKTLWGGLIECKNRDSKNMINVFDVLRREILFNNLFNELLFHFLWNIAIMIDFDQLWLLSDFLKTPKARAHGLKPHRALSGTRFYAIRLYAVCMRPVWHSQQEGSVCTAAVQPARNGLYQVRSAVRAYCPTIILCCLGMAWVWVLDDGIILKVLWTATLWPFDQHRITIPLKKI